MLAAELRFAYHFYFTRGSSLTCDRSYSLIELSKTVPRFQLSVEHSSLLDQIKFYHVQFMLAEINIDTFIRSCLLEMVVVSMKHVKQKNATESIWIREWPL